MFRFLEDLVDPYCDYPVQDRPPTRLWPFLNEYARPFHKLFAVTALMSVIVAGTPKASYSMTSHSASSSRPI